MVESNSQLIDDIEDLKKILSIAKEVGDRVGERMAYCDLGNAHYSLGKFKEAIEYHNENLSIAKEVGDRFSERGAYCNLGNAYYSLGKFQQAIKFHKKDLSMAEELGDRAAKGRAYGNLGNACDGLAKFQEAIEYHKKHLSIAKEIGDRFGEGQAYCNLGISLTNLCKPLEAIEYHNIDLSIAKEIGDLAGEGMAYCNLGNAHQSLCNFQKAIEYHNQHLSIAKEVGDRAGEGRAYGNLGNAYYSQGKFKDAITFHSKHLSIAREVGDMPGKEKAHNNLGCSYQRLGKYQEAMEHQHKCLLIAKEMGNRAAVGKAYGNLGNSYFSLGKFKEAIKYHDKHLLIAIEVKDNAGEGRAECNLGNAYHSLGKFLEAIEYHKKHLSIAKKVGVKDEEGTAYCNLGKAYCSLRQFEEAHEHHSKHLSIAKKVGDRAGEGTAYCNLGIVDNNLGKWQDAIEYHNKHLSITKDVGDRAGEGTAYCNLGKSYDIQGKFQEAIDYHSKHLSITKELGDRAGEGTAYCNLGNSYYKLGRLQEAKENFQFSVEVFDIVRASLKYKDGWKISFRDLYCVPYNGLWTSLLLLERADEALIAAERGRAQALVDDLKIQYGLTALPSSSREMKETVSYVSNEFSTQTVFLGLHCNKITFWIVNKENKLFEVRQRELHGRKGAEHTITVMLKNTWKKIKVDVPVRCENRSLDKVTDDSLSIRGDDEEPAQALCSIDSLQELHDAIIGPIADLCQGDELVIVPVGPLCLVPFSALSESLRIRTVPSLTILKLITRSYENYHSRSGALLVGDPCLKQVKDEWGKSKFKELKYARQEVETIGGILKIKPLTGTEATKSKVLERITSVALVHIAAHGRAETGEIALSPNADWEDDPTILKSRLEVRIPKEEYYMLKMSDVQAVRLRARLVVLSSCHSGEGEVKSEGVVGIARAFLAAGARSVLVSLWAISDEATMQFMKSFYYHLTNGEKASVALNQAIKTLRDSEKFCAVRNWAPFVLIGDDVKLEFGNQASEYCRPPEEKPDVSEKKEKKTEKI